ncbi:hypothetical protein SGFS_047180 [Streptomyces graminofaciens]|uniref:Uncharacterized protein n=1 Tax=Streptomyces graminofaciens TaxID=68212 RepID=A0ABN5VJ54_9ACTN|nr:hypothetical protein SGFS_047180 [Streptomyces graminofaciens]
MQHGLDAAADEGEHDDVVGVRRLGGAHRPQELDPGDLAERVRADAHLVELTGGRGGTAAQEEPVQTDVRITRMLRGDALRGEGAPFPSGVGIRENGDPEGLP